jgi:hypothetical protein
MEKGCFFCRRHFVAERKERKFCSRDCFSAAHAVLMKSRHASGEFTGSLGKKWKLSDDQVAARSKAQSGEGNNGWKGGLYLGKEYVFVRQVKRTVPLHRLVLEKKIGRFLKKNEVVHHWNEVKTDNRPENLALFRSNGAHTRLHHFARRHGLNVEDLKFEQPWLTESA